jgi:hypothetical protein
MQFLAREENHTLRRFPAQRAFGRPRARGNQSVGALPDMKGKMKCVFGSAARVYSAV